MSKIVFTGGGTAGHVTPNMALIKQFAADNWTIDYIGSSDGIEKSMIEPLGVPFHAVSCGKLRRYLSVKNLLDPFKILWGIIQAFFILHRLKPDVVFSKGGFVAFPVVVAAWLQRIPVIAHESDMSPGLANRLSFPFARKICLTFEASKKYFKNTGKIQVTGTPIRESLFLGNAEKGLALCGFDADKPCILVIGGSLGAGSVNTAVRAALNQLTSQFQVIHICGKGKTDPSLQHITGYCQFEYVHDELPDLFAAASLIISRAGANALYEILALGKAHILVPMSTQASRGDQIQNAHYFQQAGVSEVIRDETLDADTLTAAITKVMQQQETIIKRINALHIVSATDKITAILRETAN